MRAIALCRMLLLLAFTVLPDVARAGDDTARAARPPKITPRAQVRPAISDWSGGGEQVLRSGRAVSITFPAEDPDDDALTYSVASLPMGASLDPQQGVVTWRPTREQEGKHEIQLEVSDGRLTAKHTFSFIVLHDRAPADSVDERVVFKIVRAGQDTGGPAAEVVVNLAVDPDADNVTCELERAPRNARVIVRQGSAMLAWSPTTADIGEHEVVAVVSDGELRTTVRKTIVVMSEWEGRDYRGWFLLGGGPSAFLAHGDGEAFLGGTVDITFAAVREEGQGAYLCAHGIRNRDCHASHHRFYGQFEVLDSLRADAPSVFTYAAGYSASLEWRPARRYLIPHYGIDAGGLVRAGVGHRAQVHPYLGLHLWSSDKLWLDATLGYRVTPADLVNLSGPTFALRAVLNPW